MTINNSKQRKSSTKRSGNVAPARCLTLDDFLSTIDQFRKEFRLPVPQFGLKEMEKYPCTGEALETLVHSTIDRHGSEITANHHPLLSEISREVYLEPFASEVYSGWRISPKWISQSLRKLLEISIQTLNQLPTHDSKPDYNPRKLKLRALHLKKVGEEANALLKKEETLARIRAYFSKKSKEDQAGLLQVAEEMRWAAEMLDLAIAGTRIVRAKIDSPNPQVRLALYIVGWFEASTGREQYTPLESLVTAAFGAAGQETPKWVGRLAIEMHHHRRRRRQWASSLREPNKTHP